MSMTINDLINFINTTRENTDDFDWLDYPITVAFKDRDRVAVLSDITGICINGKTIQFNEEEFDKEVNA